MQSRRWSAIESVVGAASAYAISVALNYYALPWFGLHPTVSDSLGIGAVFFAASIAQRYFWRRVFNR